MSDSSGSGISNHHGDDSDSEGSVAGSVAASHASDMPDTPDSKKRARPKQIQGKAWIFYDYFLGKDGLENVFRQEKTRKVLLLPRSVHLTISGANHARKAQKLAKKEHACHDFGNLASKSLCYGWYL